MLPDDLLAEESNRLSGQRQRLERECRKLEAVGANTVDLERLRQTLPQVLARLRQWVFESTKEDIALLLEALQVQVQASHEQVLIKGVVPTPTPLEKSGRVQDFVTIERTSA